VKAPLVLLAALLGLASGSASAQQGADTTDHGIIATLADPSRATWVRPLASALIPGTGQLLGGHPRGAVYLVTEALLLTRFLALNAEGNREEDRYRELALVVARAAYAPVDQDTVFEYYEQMGRYVESGPYDTDSGPALQPPTDERTYNGQIWELARTTYFPDPDQAPPPESPEYQRALTFYTSRAIGPNYQWSWRNAGLEQDLYRQTIAASDEAFRDATTTIGLLANHVLSAVDAFVTTRLSGDGRVVEVQTGFRPGRRAGSPIRFMATVSVGL
jgi:hypothetical protein